MYYRSVPVTLEPLLPWLQRDIPEEILGVNPQNCLVFLTPVDWSQVTEVPEPVGEDEDLPFMKDVTTPKPWVFLARVCHFIFETYLTFTGRNTMCLKYNINSCFVIFNLMVILISKKMHTLP